MPGVTGVSYEREAPGKGGLAAWRNWGIIQYGRQEPNREILVYDRSMLSGLIASI